MDGDRYKCLCTTRCGWWGEVRAESHLVVGLDEPWAAVQVVAPRARATVVLHREISSRHDKIETVINLRN